MSTLIELLATKKKPAAAKAPDTTMVLPVLEKSHEGACGAGCGCGESEGGGCCSA